MKRRKKGRCRWCYKWDYLKPYPGKPLTLVCADCADAGYSPEKPWPLGDAGEPR